MWGRGCLLLGFALALGADDGHGREDAGDADAGGGDFALLETVVDELVGLGGLEVLFADDGVEVALAFFFHNDTIKAGWSSRMSLLSLLFTYMLFNLPIKGIMQMQR